MAGRDGGRIATSSATFCIEQVVYERDYLKESRIRLHRRIGCQLEEGYRSSEPESSAAELAGPF